MPGSDVLRPVRRSCTRNLLLSLALAVASAVIAAPVAIAEPKGEFNVFKECPIGIANLKGCVLARLESGEIVIGDQLGAKAKTTVPILTTETLQGGFGEANAEGAQRFFGAKNGETLSKTPQKIPGGLLGAGETSKTAVNAITELVGPASDVYLNGEALERELPFPPDPPALRLEVRIRLENQFLGRECYLGSNTEPIVLSLTTGATSPPLPNRPIKGKLGTLSSRAEGEVLVAKNDTLVGNAFAVGKAHGCGTGGSLDPAVDSRLGLPSPAGFNTAILNDTLERVGHHVVEESEYPAEESE